MTAAKKGATEAGSSSTKLPICGIIMPISALGPDYDAQHWVEVREMFDEAIGIANMRPQMVSDGIDGDVITQRIISNIFNNPVVVCDVSGLNPNVMFELGLRLASKKATIIVTDNISSLPFDTRIIEHLPYPRTLRLRSARDFIQLLAERIASDYANVEKQTYKPFLTNFTGIEPQEVAVSEITPLDAISAQLAAIQRQLARQTSNATNEPSSGIPWPSQFRRNNVINYRLNREGLDSRRMVKDISAMPEIKSTELMDDGTSELKFTVNFRGPPSMATLEAVDRVILACTPN